MTNLTRGEVRVAEHRGRRLKLRAEHADVLTRAPFLGDGVARAREDDEAELLVPVSSRRVPCTNVPLVRRGDEIRAARKNELDRWLVRAARGVELRERRILNVLRGIRVLEEEVDGLVRGVNVALDVAHAQWELARKRGLDCEVRHEEAIGDGRFERRLVGT